MDTRPYILCVSLCKREEGPVNSCAKESRTPASHQPSKAEIEEAVSIDASPEALAWAITRGGAERRDDKDK